MQNRPLFFFLSLPLYFVSSLSPIPKTRWRKVDGVLPPKVAIVDGPILIIPELNFEDEGMYECEVYNSEGRETHQGRISVQGRRTVSQLTSWGHFGKCPYMPNIYVCRMV